MSFFYSIGFLPLIFLNTAFALDLSCASLFEGKSRIENRTYNHILKVEQSINGIAHENPYMMINSDQQFRYFDIANKQELKLIGRYEIGEVDKEELHYIQNFFPTQLLDIQPLEDNKYLVYRWVVTQDVPTDFNTGAINANDSVIRAAIAQVVQNISLDHNPHKKAILFLDIDNLGIVNYFPGGHATGDAYIKAVIDIITENLRRDDHRHTDKDIGFKNYNGDEFFFLLEGVTENEIPMIIKRLDAALETDPRMVIIKIKALGQYVMFKKFIKSLRNYSALENTVLLPYIQNSRLWNRLSAGEKAEINSSPEAFKKFILTFLQSAEFKKIGKNITRTGLGGTFGIETIKVGDTLEAVLYRASQVMAERKMQKKSGKNKKIIKEDIYFPEL